MRIRLAITILFLLCFKWSLAQQVTTEEAIAVAKTELLYTKGLSVEITDVHSFDSNGHTLLFEIVSDAGLNVLVSGNKLCLPVVGRYKSYDRGSIFNQFDELPCGLKCLIQSYKHQVEYSFQTRGIESTHDFDWSRMLIGENVYLTRNIGSVEPLIKTRWRQRGTRNGNDSCGYEFFIPPDNGCDHCPAGCVAVAMAQVMNYWKWPVLTTDNWQFDWCNMPEALDTGSENYISERNAVARLLERCGYRAKMNYGCSGSESNVYRAKKAMDKFGYNEESDHQWRILNRRTWIRHLRDNLDRGWPVIYGASGLYDPDGLFPGHAFVCDGYSSDGKFHFNWGWGGYSDGYFPVDSLCPGNNDYNLFNSAIFDLYPAGETLSFCDISLPLDVFYLMYIVSNPDSNVVLYNITPQTFNQLESASASSSASWRTIPAGATAEYVAHKEVILQPGFTAEYGSNFTARIEPCEACEERMVQVDMLTDGDDWQGIDTSQMEMRMYRKGDTAILFQPSVLTLFPNPTSNTLTVQAPNPTEDIQIFDIAGHRVYRWYIESRTEKSTILNIADIPTGNYILRVQTKDGKSHIGRFSKK